MTETVPEVITRYLAAADKQDAGALAACFAADGTVVDEGHTYTRPDEIRAWRAELAGKWEYTVTATGSERIGDGHWRVRTHTVGNFPGGEVDLSYDFTIRDNQIAALSIVD